MMVTRKVARKVARKVVQMAVTKGKTMGLRMAGMTEKPKARPRDIQLVAMTAMRLAAPTDRKLAE
jgi:hypothetical protein